MIPSIKAIQPARLLLFLVLFFVATAWGADRETKIGQLMKAQGLLPMFEQEMGEGRRRAREQAESMVQQLMSSLNPTKEFQSRFQTAFDEFIKGTEPPWTAKDVVNEWARIYGAKFTDAELDDLLKWYTSPLGQKDTAASQAALPEFTAHYTALSKPILERATKTFIERLQLIAKECDCRK